MRRHLRISVTVEAVSFFAPFVAAFGFAYFKKKTQTPPATNASQAATKRRGLSAPRAEYRAEEARLAPFEQVARMVVGRRIELDITQEQLAERMGTSSSTISRIESDQHVTSVRTLERLASALGVKLLVGFENRIR